MKNRPGNVPRCLSCGQFRAGLCFEIWSSVARLPTSGYQTGDLIESLLEPEVGAPGPARRRCQADALQSFLDEP